MHSGVLTAAAAIYKDLQRHHILEELLQGPGAMPPLPNQKPGQEPSRDSKPDNGSSPKHHQHPSDQPDGSEAADGLLSASSNSSKLHEPPRKLQDAPVTNATAPKLSSSASNDRSAQSDPAGQSDAQMQSDDEDETARERHQHMAETVEDGQELVASLVHASNQAGGDGKADGPEARAEEERQLGSLRARKLDCKVGDGHMKLAWHMINVTLAPCQNFATFGHLSFPAQATRPQVKQADHRSITGYYKQCASCALACGAANLPWCVDAYAPTLFFPARARRPVCCRLDG